jgi:hypothetical protein
MQEKKGFYGYLWSKKYKYSEFLEPLFALPFAYALLRILEGQFNTLTFVIIFVLMLIYLPTIIVFVESKRFS